MVINNYNLAVSLTCTVGVSVSVIGTDSVFFPSTDEGNLQCYSYDQGTNHVNRFQM